MALSHDFPLRSTELHESKIQMKPLKVWTIDELEDYVGELKKIQEDARTFLVEDTQRGLMKESFRKTLGHNAREEKMNNGEK